MSDTDVVRQTRSARVARRFEKPIVVATLLVIPAIIVETSNAGASLKETAQALNWVIWSVFVLEVVVMLAIETDRLAWLRHHPLEIAIILITAPLLPSGLQFARFLRLLRLLRLALVVRLTRRMLSPVGLQFAAATVFIAVLGGAGAFDAAERGHQPEAIGLWDSLWWAMSTVATVGYGDVVPHTIMGRIIGMALMLIGIGFVALLTGAIAQRFLGLDRDHDLTHDEPPPLTQRDLMRELRSIAQRLEQLETSVIHHWTFDAEPGTEAN